MRVNRKELFSWQHKADSFEDTRGEARLMTCVTQHRFLSTYFRSRRWDYEKKTRFFSCNTKQYNQSYHLGGMKKEAVVPARLIHINLLSEMLEIYDFLVKCKMHFLTFSFCNFSSSLKEWNGDVEKLANKSHSKVNEREKLVRHQAAPAKASEAKCGKLKKSERRRKTKLKSCRPNWKHKQRQRNSFPETNFKSLNRVLVCTKSNSIFALKINIPKKFMSF